MALEEITTDVDIQTPIKKKLGSMKKKSTAEAPNPFKNKKEMMDYKKNMESIVKPGYGEMGFKERSITDMVEKKPIASKKAKVGVMKKLGKAAGEAVHELPHKMLKEHVLEHAVDLAPFKVQEPIEEGRLAEEMKKVGKAVRELPELASNPKLLPDEYRKNKVLETINEKSKSDFKTKSKLEALKASKK